MQDPFLSENQQTEMLHDFTGQSQSEFDDIRKSRQSSLKFPLTPAEILVYAKRNEKGLVQISCEVMILLSVFLASFYAYKATKTVSLIPPSQCNSCNGDCVAITTLNNQDQFTYLRMNFRSKYQDSLGVYHTNYTVIDFESTWISCQIDDPSTFTHNAAMNMTTVNLPSSSNNSYYTLYEDQAVAVLMNLSPTYSYDGLEEYPPSSCFQLSCNMRATPGQDFFFPTVTDLITTIEPPTDDSVDYSPPGVIVGQLYGQIVTKVPGSVSATCLATISGTLVPISSSSNTVSPSSVYQCTSHPNDLSSIAIALSYTLTLASLLHLGYYFWGVIHNKKGGERS